MPLRLPPYQQYRSCSTHLRVSPYPPAHITVLKRAYGPTGSELVYAYSSIHFSESSSGDTLTFAAANCTFPPSGAFVTAAVPRGYDDGAKSAYGV
eukprot:3661241-Rhodomonas_salina.1